MGRAGADLDGLLQAMRRRAPQGAETLWEFIRCYYRLAVPRRRVCRHHVAPFDYVWASYSQQLGDLVVWANRGGAKTELGSVTSHLDSIFRPGCQTRILGGSLQQSERMYAYLTGKWQPHFADLLAAEPRSRRTVLRNKSVIEVLTQSQRSVRGQRVQRVKCDEVDEFDPEVWRAVQFVTQSRGGTRASLEAFSTMHNAYGLMSQVVDRATDVGPLIYGRGHGASEVLAGQSVGAAGGGLSAGGAVEGEQGQGAGGGRTWLFAWCLWETIEKCRGDWSCSRCGLSEDCQGRAREADGFIGIEDALAQKRRSGRSAWESEMLCMRPRQDRLVFPQFSRSRHVRRVVRHGQSPVYRSLDFGFANPFVCLWAQVVGDDPETARVEVLEEYVQPQRTVAEHAAVLKDRPWPVRATYCDPAGWQRSDVTGSGACQELRRHGILTKSCQSGIIEGVEQIRAMLAPALGPVRLVIDGGCERLVRALECYHYGASVGPGSELPVKDGVHDHLIDALRYLMINLFGRRGGKLREVRYW